MIHIINIQIVIIVSGEENDLDIRVDPKQVIGQSDPGLITKLDIDESQIIVLAFCSKSSSSGSAKISERVMTGSSEGSVFCGVFNCSSAIFVIS